MNVDIWQYSENENKIFTDSEEILKMIMKICKINPNEAAINNYYFKGEIIGWDILFDSSLISKINLKLSRLKKLTNYSADELIEIIKKQKSDAIKQDMKIDQKHRVSIMNKIVKPTKFFTF